MGKYSMATRRPGSGSSRLARAAWNDGQEE